MSEVPYTPEAQALLRKHGVISDEGKVNAAPVTEYTSAEILDVPPPEWLVEGLVQQQGVTMLVGPPKTGKTFFVLDLAVELARDYNLETEGPNREWFGQRVLAWRPRKVMYLATEGWRFFGRRLQGTLQDRDYAWSDLQDRLIVVPGPRPLWWAQSKWGKTATVPKPTRELLVTLSEHQQRGAPVDLLVFDTLFHHSGGANLSDNQDAEIIIHHLLELTETFGCSVVVVHHTVRSEERYLGAQALLGGVDVQVNLSQTRPAGAQPYLRMKSMAREGDTYSLPVRAEMHAVDVPDLGQTVVLRPRVTGPSTDKVLAVLREDTAATTQEVAEKAEMVVRTAQKHLMRLAEAGEVEMVEEASGRNPASWRKTPGMNPEPELL